jgi:hypothetical protein
LIGENVGRTRFFGQSSRFFNGVVENPFDPKGSTMSKSRISILSKVSAAGILAMAVGACSGTGSSAGTGKEVNGNLSSPKFGKSKKALGCAPSGTTPSVNYCGTKQGLIYITIADPAIGNGFDTITRDALGTYTMNPSLGPVAPNAPVRFRAWMDVQHSHHFNAAVDPFVEVVWNADGAGNIRLPDLDLQDPFNPHIPATSPDVIPITNGAIVFFERMVNPVTEMDVVDTHKVTAIPDSPSVTCVERVVEVRTDVPVALFSNLDDSCTYTFTLRGTSAGQDLPQGPPTGSVTIGAPNPGGSYVVSGDVETSGITGYLTGSSKFYVVAFGSGAPTGAGAPLPTPPSTLAPYTMNLVDDGYEAFVLVDIDGDGELESGLDVFPDDYFQPSIGFTVSGSAMSPPTLTPNPNSVVLVMKTVRHQMDGNPETYFAELIVTGLMQGVVSAEVTGATGISPAGLSFGNDLYLKYPGYDGNFWWTPAYWGASAPTIGGSASYSVGYCVEDPVVEIGGPGFTCTSTTIGVPTIPGVSPAASFVELVSGVSVSGSPTPTVSWSLPANMPSGATIRIRIGAAGGPAINSPFPPIYDEFISGASTSWTAPNPLGAGNYDASIAIFDTLGNRSDYIIPFTI